ncbi:MAG TPA: calcium-binding protein, partial [Gammaproteobacteria bacterium]|nr:calcium-binding protein [Gammaproteobacteria bacterium]
MTVNETGFSAMLGTWNVVAGFAGLAEQIGDGEFTVEDVAAASAAIGAALSRTGNPALMEMGAVFAGYSLIVPWLAEFGERLGYDLFHTGTEFGSALPWFLSNFDAGEFFGYLSDDIHGFFFGSQSWARRRYYDPLALDLDGDGIETTEITNWQATTLFDHDANGVADGTGWLSGDDGWLVRDLNANGTIDTGAELFGNNTTLSNGTTAAEGFSALSDLDSNSDGVIDASDAAFAELKVWQDVNQDGISQTGELSSLTDLGVASISLASTSVSQPQSGATVTATSTFTRTDGTTSTVGNLDLAASSFYTEFTDANDGDTTLPDVHGAGAVRNLRDAASRSAPLASALTQYSTANRDGQEALLDALIDSWTATSGMHSMVERAEDAMYFVLYEFGNQPTIDDTQVMDAMAVITGGGDGSGSVVGGGLSQFIADAMDSQTRADYQKWFRIISVLERFNGEEFISFEQPTATNPITIVDTGNYTTSGGGTVDLGYDFIRIRVEQTQLDLLQQSYNALRDSVYDSLVVQTRLRPYLDAIALTMANGAIALDFADLDALFDANFASNDIDAAWDLVDLDRTVGSQLRTSGWSTWAYLTERLSSAGFALSAGAASVMAASGVLIAPSNDGAILQATGELRDVIGRNGADSLIGSGDANQLHGGKGNDSLTGNSGNDSLYGGEGEDTLDGGDGVNYLDGGAGNDVMTAAVWWSTGNVFRGGTGDDTMDGSGNPDEYRYRMGDGRDVIDENSTNPGVEDTIVLEDLNPGDVQLTREGTSLVINVLADGGQIKVEDWYTSTGYRVEKLVFADGTEWGVDYLNHLGMEVHGTEGADTLVGLAVHWDRLHGEGGNDSLTGNSGNDSLYGGE